MSFGNKIGDLQQGSTPISRANETSVSQGRVRAAGTKPVASEDKAEVSPASVQIADALKTSDARMDKVEALRKAIADGSYSVSSSEVADSIMKSMSE